jgi:glutathione S-transferase
MIKNRTNLSPPEQLNDPTPSAVLTISSKNYSSWSLRGWLLCKIAGLDFAEKILPIDDPTTRAELLLLSPSFLVPCLTHGNVTVWDTLAIGEYLNELELAHKILPEDGALRAHCRAVCGEMHSGFMNLRSALPQNLKKKYSEFRIWAGAQADIDRVSEIWTQCLTRYGGPHLFGELSMADAMYAPVCGRFTTYNVKLDRRCSDYCDRIMNLSDFREWIDAAKAEPEELEELDVEF